jgi:hypothetical protein
LMMSEGRCKQKSQKKTRHNANAYGNRWGVQVVLMVVGGGRLDIAAGKAHPPWNNHRKALVAP